VSSCSCLPCLANKLPLHCEVSSVTTVCSGNQNVYPRRKLSLGGCTPGSEVSSCAATAQNVSVGKQLSVDEGRLLINSHYFCATVCYCSMWYGPVSVHLCTRISVSHRYSVLYKIAKLIITKTTLCSWLGTPFFWLTPKILVNFQFWLPIIEAP